MPTSTKKGRHFSTALKNYTAGDEDKKQHKPKKKNQP
jgi:hypothetical protein